MSTPYAEKDYLETLHDSFQRVKIGPGNYALSVGSGFGSGLAVAAALMGSYETAAGAAASSFIAASINQALTVRQIDAVDTLESAVEAELLKAAELMKRQQGQ